MIPEGRSFPKLIKLEGPSLKKNTKGTKRSHELHKVHIYKSLQSHKYQKDLERVIFKFIVYYISINT